MALGRRNGAGVNYQSRHFFSQTKGNMTKTATFQDVAKELADAFEQRKRYNGDEIQVIKDDAPEWTKRYNDDRECLMLRVHKSIDDRLPDDWIYGSASAAADRIAESYTADEARESVTEWADSHVDVYNTELTRWLASHLFNISLCDEAVEETGVGTAGGIIGMIQAGQFMALERIANALINEIEKELEARE